MNNKPYLLFDAGGTLVFPDQVFLLKTVREIGGLEISAEQLFETHWELVYQIDIHAKNSGTLVNLWNESYQSVLLKSLGITNSRLDDALAEISAYDETNNLWAFTYEWVSQALEILKTQGYQMSVISNADGRVNSLLEHVRLHHFFDFVFDSKIVGYEKPSPKIFQTAMQELDLSPEHCVYIGDIFYIDVWGANQVGVAGLHLDPANKYRSWPGVHVSDIRQLPQWLAENQENLGLLGYPLRNYPLKY